MKLLKAAVDDGRIDAQREAGYYLDYLVAERLIDPSSPQG
jgi:hypothetical protein